MRTSKGEVLNYSLKQIFDANPIRKKKLGTVLGRLSQIEIIETFRPPDREAVNKFSTFNAFYYIQTRSASYLEILVSAALKG